MTSQIRGKPVTTMPHCDDSTTSEGSSSSDSHDSTSDDYDSTDSSSGYAETIHESVEDNVSTKPRPSLGKRVVRTPPGTNRNTTLVDTPETADTTVSDIASCSGSENGEEPETLKTNLIGKVKGVKTVSHESKPENPSTLPPTFTVPPLANKTVPNRAGLKRGIGRSRSADMGALVNGGADLQRLAELMGLAPDFFIKNPGALAPGGMSGATANGGPRLRTSVVASSAIIDVFEQEPLDMPEADLLSKMRADALGMSSRSTSTRSNRTSLLRGTSQRASRAYASSRSKFSSLGQKERKKKEMSQVDAWTGSRHDSVSSMESGDMSVGTITSDFWASEKEDLPINDLPARKISQPQARNLPAARRLSVELTLKEAPARNPTIDTDTLFQEPSPPIPMQDELSEDYSTTSEDLSKTVYSLLGSQAGVLGITLDPSTNAQPQVLHVADSGMLASRPSSGDYGRTYDSNAGDTSNSSDSVDQFFLRAAGNLEDAIGLGPSTELTGAYNPNAYDKRYENFTPHAGGLADALGFSTEPSFNAQPPLDSKFMSETRLHQSFYDSDSVTSDESSVPSEESEDEVARFAPRAGSLFEALGVAVDPSSRAAPMPQTMMARVIEDRRQYQTGNEIETNDGKSFIRFAPQPGSLAEALGVAMEGSSAALPTRQSTASMEDSDSYSDSTSDSSSDSTSDSSGYGDDDLVRVAPQPRSLAEALGLSVYPSSGAPLVRQPEYRVAGEPVVFQPKSGSLAEALGFTAKPSLRTTGGGGSDKIQQEHSHNHVTSTSRSNLGRGPLFAAASGSLADAVGLTVHPSSQAPSFHAAHCGAAFDPSYASSDSASDSDSSDDGTPVRISAQPGSLASALGIGVDPSSRAPPVRYEGNKTKEASHPSTQWKGAMPGYFFGTGSLGTGYYLDQAALVDSVVLRTVNGNGAKISVGLLEGKPQIGSLAAALDMRIDTSSDALPVRAVNAGRKSKSLFEAVISQSVQATMPKKGPRFDKQPAAGSLAAALGMSIETSSGAPAMTVQTTESGKDGRSKSQPATGSLAAALGMTIDTSSGVPAMTVQTTKSAKEGRSKSQPAASSPAGKLGKHDELTTHPAAGGLAEALCIKIDMPSALDAQTGSFITALRAQTVTPASGVVNPNDMPIALFQELPLRTACEHLASVRAKAGSLAAALGSPVDQDTAGLEAVSSSVYHKPANRGKQSLFDAVIMGAAEASTKKESSLDSDYMKNRCDMIRNGVSVAESDLSRPKVSQESDTNVSPVTRIVATHDGPIGFPEGLAVENISSIMAKPGTLAVALGAPADQHDVIQPVTVHSAIARRHHNGVKSSLLETVIAAAAQAVIQKESSSDPDQTESIPRKARKSPLPTESQGPGHSPSNKISTASPITLPVATAAISKGRAATTIEKTMDVQKKKARSMVKTKSATLRRGEAGCSSIISRPSPIASASAQACARREQQDDLKNMNVPGITETVGSSIEPSTSTVTVSPKFAPSSATASIQAQESAKRAHLVDGRARKAPAAAKTENTLSSTSPSTKATASRVSPPSSTTTFQGQQTSLRRPSADTMELASDNIEQRKDVLEAFETNTNKSVMSSKMVVNASASRRRNLFEPIDSSTSHKPSRTRVVAEAATENIVTSFAQVSEPFPGEEVNYATLGTGSNVDSKSREKKKRQPTTGDNNVINDDLGTEYPKNGPIKPLFKPQPITIEEKQKDKEKAMNRLERIKAKAIKSANRELGVDESVLAAVMGLKAQAINANHSRTINPPPISKRRPNLLEAAVRDVSSGKSRRMQSLAEVDESSVTQSFRSNQENSGGEPDIRERTFKPQPVTAEEKCADKQRAMTRLERIKAKAIKSAQRELGVDVEGLASAMGMIAIANKSVSNGNGKKNSPATHSKNEAEQMEFLAESLGLPPSFFGVGEFPVETSTAELSDLEPATFSEKPENVNSKAQTPSTESSLAAQQTSLSPTVEVPTKSAQPSITVETTVTGSVSTPSVPANESQSNTSPTASLDLEPTELIDELKKMNSRAQTPSTESSLAAQQMNLSPTVELPIKSAQPAITVETTVTGSVSTPSVPANESQSNTSPTSSAFLDLEPTELSDELEKMNLKAQSPSTGSSLVAQQMKLSPTVELLIKSAQPAIASETTVTGSVSTPSVPASKIQSKTCSISSDRHATGPTSIGISPYSAFVEATDKMSSEIASLGCSVDLVVEKLSRTNDGESRNSEICEVKASLQLLADEMLTVREEIMGVKASILSVERSMVPKGQEDLSAQTLDLSYAKQTIKQVVDDFEGVIITKTRSYNEKLSEIQKQLDAHAEQVAKKTNEMRQVEAFVVHEVKAHELLVNRLAGRDEYILEACNVIQENRALLLSELHEIKKLKETLEDARHAYILHHSMPADDIFKVVSIEDRADDDDGMAALTFDAIVEIQRKLELEGQRRRSVTARLKAKRKNQRRAVIDSSTTQDHHADTVDETMSPDGVDNYVSPTRISGQDYCLVANSNKALITSDHTSGFVTTSTEPTTTTVFKQELDTSSTKHKGPDSPIVPQLLLQENSSKVQNAERIPASESMTKNKIQEAAVFITPIELDNTPTEQPANVKSSVLDSTAAEVHEAGLVDEVHIFVASPENSDDVLDHVTIESVPTSTMNPMESTMIIAQDAKQSVQEHSGQCEILKEGDCELVLTDSTLDVEFENDESCILDASAPGTISTDQVVLVEEEAVLVASPKDCDDVHDNVTIESVPTSTTNPVEPTMIIAQDVKQSVQEHSGQCEILKEGDCELVLTDSTLDVEFENDESCILDASTPGTTSTDQVVLVEEEAVLVASPKDCDDVLDNVIMDSVLTSSMNPTEQAWEPTGINTPDEKESLVDIADQPETREDGIVDIMEPRNTVTDHLSKVVTSILDADAAEKTLTEGTRTILLDRLKLVEAEVVHLSSEKSKDSADTSTVDPSEYLEMLSNDHDTPTAVKLEQTLEPQRDVTAPSPEGKDPKRNIAPQKMAAILEIDSRAADIPATSEPFVVDGCEVCNFPEISNKADFGDEQDSTDTPVVSNKRKEPTIVDCPSVHEILLSARVSPAIHTCAPHDGTADSSPWVFGAVGFVLMCSFATYVAYAGGATPANAPVVVHDDHDIASTIPPELPAFFEDEGMEISQSERVHPRPTSILVEKTSTKAEDALIGRCDNVKEYESPMESLSLTNIREDDRVEILDTVDTMNDESNHSDRTLRSESSESSLDDYHPLPAPNAHLFAPSLSVLHSSMQPPEARAARKAARKKRRKQFIDGLKTILKRELEDNMYV